VQQISTGSRPQALAAVLEPPDFRVIGLRSSSSQLPSWNAAHIPGLPISSFAAVVFGNGFVRTAIALVYLLVNLRHGASNFAMPSIGERSGSLSCPPVCCKTTKALLVRLAECISLGVSAVGIVLYVVNEAIAWDRGSAKTNSR
jgi:hypothetical protein